jgi:tetratricopeptide (TPR) repeat protein
MDGRVRSVVLASLTLAALNSVGCQSLQKQPTLPSATLPVAGSHKTGFFSSAPKYGPPAEQIPIREARAKNAPFKPGTYVAVGDAELEAAFDENRVGADRDQMIDVARQRYSAALQQDPKNKEALLGLGRLYTWAADRERAMQMYQEAAKHHPKDKDIAFAMVKCHVRFQDWEAACKSCEAALALDPENRHVTKALGYCQARVNRWEDSFGTLMKIMSESEARTFLGQTLIAVGRPEEGQSQLKLAANDPNNKNAQNLLAEFQNPQPPVQQVGFEAQPR